MRCISVVLVTMSLTTGCAPFVDRVKMSEVPLGEAQAALAIRVFPQSVPQPPVVTRYIGTVEAFSCKNKIWDKPASTGDAIAQLRLKALRMGANAVMGVSTDTRGTDALGTNCWESVQASGTAVVIP
jgi:hypothetical protein